jgi:hypothetical protein
MSRDLRIRVRTIGTEATRAAIRSITRETQQGTARQRQATRGRLADEQAAARAIASAHTQMERARLRETERSARAQTRAVEREAQSQRRAQEREASAAARAQARRAEQRRRGLRALPGAVGTAGLAAADAVIGRARGYQSSLGIQSRDQLVSGFVDRQERLIRLSANSGLSADALQSTISSASQGALTSQDDVLGALERAQASLVGGDTTLQFFVDNVERLARASRAAGGTTEDWTVAVGQMQRQLGVSASDTEQLIGVMVSAARAGAIEAGDFAEQFSGILSQFRSLRGEQGAGIGGAREFGAVAQALGQGGRSPAEVRTLMQNMLAGLTRSDTQRNIERRLGDRNIFDRNGTLTIGLGELIQRMAGDADFQSATTRQDIFGRDLQINEAFTTLLNGARNGANPIGDLQAVNAAEGQGVIDDFFTQLEASTAGDVLGIRSRAEAQFATNGGDLVAHEARLAAALSDVETRFPLATEAVGALRDIVATTTAAFGALNLAMGGSALGGGAAGAAAAAGGGTAGGGLLAAGATALGAGAVLGAGLVLATAGTAGGDVSAEQVAAQQQRRDAMLSPEALTAMRGVQGVSRAELGRRVQAEYARTGQTLTAQDIETLAAAIRAGAAAGVAQGQSAGARDARTAAGRSATHTR